MSPKARVGITVYRDRREAPKIRLEYQALSSEVEPLKEFLDKIKAKSTSRDRDRPEWMCRGLRAAILGEPYASPPSDAATNSNQAVECIAVAKYFRDQGGQVHIVSTLPAPAGVELVSQNGNEVLEVNQTIAAGRVQITFSSYPVLNVQVSTGSLVSLEIG